MTPRPRGLGRAVVSSAQLVLKTPPAGRRPARQDSQTARSGTSGGQLCPTGAEDITGGVGGRHARTPRLLGEPTPGVGRRQLRRAFHFVYSQGDCPVDVHDVRDG